MKKILSAALALAMTLSLLPAAFAADGTAYASTQSVEVDGKKVEFQMYALKDAAGNPTNYVKLRDVAHVLNGTRAQFSVGYDGSISVVTGEAYADAGGEMTTPYSGDRAYRTGSGAVKVNGQSASLESIILTDDAGGDYTYFKLRDLGSALGFKVDWSADRGVIVETEESSVPPQTTAPADDGKLTLDKLQGVWRDKEGTCECIISGNQITITTENSKTCFLRAGTINELAVDYTNDWIFETYPYAVLYSGTEKRLRNNPQPGEERLSETSYNSAYVGIKEVDPAKNGYLLEHNGYQLERVSSSQRYDVVLAKIGAYENKCYEAFPTVPDFGAYTGVKGLTYTGSTSNSLRSVRYRYSIDDVAAGKKSGTSYEGYYQLLQDNGFKGYGDGNYTKGGIFEKDGVMVTTLYEEYLGSIWFTIIIIGP